MQGSITWSARFHPFLFRYSTSHFLKYLKDHPNNSFNIITNKDILGTLKPKNCYIFYLKNLNLENGCRIILKFMPI